MCFLSVSEWQDVQAAAVQADSGASGQKTVLKGAIEVVVKRALVADLHRRGS
jgi:hypothetical protein